MPDQLKMLEQETEFHQGLFGWNKIHGMDDNSALRAQPCEKALLWSLLLSEPWPESIA